MLTFSVISNGFVVNNIIAETLEVAEEVTGETCVLGALEIGRQYDLETGALVEIPEVEAVESETDPFDVSNLTIIPTENWIIEEA